jgi:hypothetical protein
MQDQVKIQKWDEQSYYSLKSSAEKSHAVLHKLVCEFDEILKTPVAGLLDTELENVAKGATPAVVAAVTHEHQPLPKQGTVWLLYHVLTPQTACCAFLTLRQFNPLSDFPVVDYCVYVLRVRARGVDLQANGSQSTLSQHRYALAISSHIVASARVAPSPACCNVGVFYGNCIPGAHVWIGRRLQGTTDPPPATAARPHVKADVQVRPQRCCVCIPCRGRHRRG